MSELNCQISHQTADCNRGPATCALLQPQISSVPLLSCDACAVKAVTGADPEWGWHIVSLDEWRRLVAPQLAAANDQLAAAKRRALPAAEQPWMLALAASQQSMPSLMSTPEPGTQPAATPAHVNKRALRVLAILAPAIFLLIGPVFIAGGNSMNNNIQDVPGAGGHLIVFGVILLVLPLLFWGLLILIAVARASARGARQYREWMATLTPEQRKAVRIAEFAAASAAAIALHEHNKSPGVQAKRQAVQDSIVHGGPLKNPWAQS